MNIGPLEIGPSQPCRVVCELSNNHNGDLDRAYRLLEAVKESGADAAKFQAYSPAELVALRGDGPAPDPWGKQGWSMQRLYTKAQTPLPWFPKLVARCEHLELPWFASVYGIGSLALLDALGCPVYKVAALEWGKRGLLAMIRKTGKPIIRSCPEPKAPKTEDALLYCPAGYPQKGIDLHALESGYTGFSYHGTDPLIPTLAAAFGAQLVEVHIQLDDEPSELEAGVSLSITQLADLVAGVQRAEAVVA